MATRKKKQEAAEKGIRQQMEFLYGKENAEHPLYQTAFHVHNEVVQYCEYCRKPMNRSEVNDYGSLCEACYMKEYYGEG